ncbi:nuclear speckle splicing regulatory protein 1-like [Dorcoceras hygrometricum]|uniref:Nuclear speckle splicing regulatory protein 1-like n=1 Tax=Dorcoceras hygrometricum TaxID=472368 RepID=A0A2Z7A747_9LAMI|nr:nuclear speckle splicing regulatory protein 1-like [Dorcoceras hygrometricum]
MKKFGLQLRVQTQQKKQPPKLPNPTLAGFEDDDDDNVEREILRQASKNKSLKDAEEQHKKALEEDPLAFDYDGVYDEMKEKQVRPREQDRQDRKPKYIQELMDKAKQREREHEIIYERKLAKERNQDEHLYVDKDKFVTGAYKRKLAEQAKWMEEERLREMREEKEAVTKKTDLSDFYFNLAKNVAFGAGKADPQKLKKQPEEVGVLSPEEVSPPNTQSNPESSSLEMRHQAGTVENLSPNQKLEQASVQTVSDASRQDEVLDKPSASGDQLKPYHHKRSEDSLAAAKERYLARKKSKVQY